MKKKLILRPFDYYALLFFTTAFAGWLWEVLLYVVTDHTFVNRGVYRGPYLPIYGVGCVILILFLHKMRRQPGFVFVISCLLCSTLEYFSGVWLEKNGVFDGGITVNISLIFKDISALQAQSDLALAAYFLSAWYNLFLTSIITV